MRTINDIKKALEQAGIRPQSCSYAEISMLETHWQLQLPMVYRSFLMHMGNGAGRFMEGSDVFYNFLFDLNSWGRLFTAENHLPPLPDNAYVFWMHQGYNMAYFTCDDNDDPHVFLQMWTEDGITELCYPSLADFLYEQLIASGIVTLPNSNIIAE